MPTYKITASFGDGQKPGIPVGAETDRAAKEIFLGFTLAAATIHGHPWVARLLKDGSVIATDYSGDAPFDEEPTA